MSVELKDIHLLIVDDDESLRSTLCEFFEDECLSISSAGNGKEALEVMSTKSIDVVLSDIRMPVMDGVELLKSIKAKDKVKPIVWLMSGQSEINEESALKLGAEGLLGKPFRLQAVLDKFSESLAKK